MVAPRPGLTSWGPVFGRTTSRFPRNTSSSKSAKSHSSNFKRMKKKRNDCDLWAEAYILHEIISKEKFCDDACCSRIPGDKKWTKTTLNFNTHKEKHPVSVSVCLKPSSIMGLLGRIMFSTLHWITPKKTHQCLLYAEPSPSSPVSAT